MADQQVPNTEIPVDENAEKAPNSTHRPDLISPEVAAAISGYGPQGSARAREIAKANLEKLNP